MSLWRKRNVKHNEQKHDNLSNSLYRLHEENVRLGLYEDAYDLSIKSEDLSIKSWVDLTDEEMMDAIYVDDTPMERGRRVEAKLKEKNT